VIGVDGVETQKITTEYRLAQWAQVIKARVESGQSIGQYQRVQDGKTASVKDPPKNAVSLANQGLARLTTWSGWRDSNPRPHAPKEPPRREKALQIQRFLKHNTAFIQLIR